MAQCKNCDRPVQESFCSYCGQPADVAHISFYFVLGEFLHFFTHIPDRFLFTSVRMLVAPSTTVRDSSAGNADGTNPPSPIF